MFKIEGYPRQEIENEGLTPIFIAIDGNLEALLAILDPTHVGAPDAVQRIRTAVVSRRRQPVGSTSARPGARRRDRRSEERFSRNAETDLESRMPSSA